MTVWRQALPLPGPLNPRPEHPAIFDRRVSVAVSDGALQDAKFGDRVLSMPPTGTILAWHQRPP